MIGLYEVGTDTFKETSVLRMLTTGGRFVTVAGLGDAGDCALIGESFTRAPELAMIEKGAYRCVKSFDLGYAEDATALRAVEEVVWNAADGLEIQGWLLCPQGASPHPLLMQVHGGPVWHWRHTWLGRGSAALIMLLKRGYAVFMPNPRGSAGRGQAFVRPVLGDMGGADAQDLLAGLDHLSERGLIDPKGLYVTGVSYGGFMTCWLITHDDRFAAAIPVAPVTNQVTEHLISNISHFVAAFLDDTYSNPTGKYFERSPVMYASRVRTPALNICGALDRCTPAEEAIQFHNALLENGVESVLVTYPEEGHGIRKFPAMIDYAARVVGWIEAHHLN